MDRLLLFILLFPTITTSISYFVGKRNELYRNIINILTTLVNFLVILYMYKYIKEGTLNFQVTYVMGTGLNLKLNSFRYIFVLITSFIWFIVNIYSSQYLFNYIHRNRYHFFFMVTYISTLGIFISENIINLFTFFEIMSFSSYPLIIHDEDDEAHEAGETYMNMAVAGGMILLMGIFIMYSYTQVLNVSELYLVLPRIGPIKYVISSLLIIGFGIKAGIVPLHIWLPKAHPAAPTPASAILSGILVKTGIFGVMLTVIFLMDKDFYLSLGMVIFGFINIFTGGILALFPVNIKRTLAYSTMSQIGYIILGIGLMGLMKDHGYLAVYGTMFHIFNHAVFKVMLFMGVGIIYMITHELNINKLYGFGRFKPILKITFFIGFCAIIGLPGFNGYLSKTLIHHSLTEYLHDFSSPIRITVEILFTLGSSITTAYLLKLYISLFVEDNSKYYASYRKYINKRALFPMVISSIIIIYIGINPNIFERYFFSLYNIFSIDLHSVHTIQFYSLKNMFSSFLTIGLGIIIYLKYVLPNLRQEKNGHMDYFDKTRNWISIEENIYNPVFKFMFLVSTFILRIFDTLLLKIAAYISYSLRFAANIEFQTYPNPMDKLNSMIYSFYIKFKDRKSKKTKKEHKLKDKIKESYNKPHMKINLSELEGKIKDYELNAKENFKSNIKHTVESGKNIHIKEKAVNKIKDSEKITTIKKDFDETKYKMNSITYSIYLVGIVMVVVLLALIIFNT